MNRSSIRPENLPEALIWYYIIYTYILYLLGAQYVAATLLGTCLTYFVFKQWWEETSKTPPEERIRLAPLNWVWIIAVLVIEFALIVGHFDYNLGMGRLIRSTIFWYRGWGLFVLFPLAGHLKIRPEIIYRAACILCFQTLIIAAIFWVAGQVEVPRIAYASPFRVFGGGALPSSVKVPYIREMGGIRLLLFAPWAPALGLVGNIYLWLAIPERNLKWRFLGIAGAVTMIVASLSRLALMTLPFVPIFIWLLTHCLRPWFQISAGFLTPLFVMILPFTRNLMQTLKERFYNARPGSSKVRKALKEMARQKWEQDAPIWGHGILQTKGPAVTAGVPIGSHHTWLGILYMHGIFAFVALVLAIFLSLLDLGIKAFSHQTAKIGLAILMVLMLFSLGENIDTLAYLYWPGLIIMGQGFKEELT